MRQNTGGFSDCIFDLYGTLVDIRTNEEKPEVWERLSQFYAYYRAFYAPEEMHAAYDRLTKNLSAGKEGGRRDSHEAFPEIQIEEVFRALFEEKGAEADEPLVRHAGQFFRILTTEKLRLYDGTKKMLQTLRDRGKKVYLLSNAQKIFTEYEMNALDITQYFDAIFLSSEHGCKKPDSQFFQKMIDTCHIKPDKAVMVGNDGACDIEGAKRSGLSTVYVRTEISPEETLPDADHVLEKMDMVRITELLCGRYMVLRRSWTT